MPSGEVFETHGFDMYRFEILNIKHVRKEKT